MEKTWGMGLIGPENRGTGFMIDIAVRDLKKEYEVGQPVLDGLTFQVDTGERVGILGRNGAGKTTLFRILTGQEEADSGEVILSPGKRLGLISQIPVYPAGYTVEDVLRTAFDDLKAMEAELHQISDQLGSGDKDLLARYDRLQAAYEAGGGYEIETRLEKICAGLGIERAFRDKNFADLSGGEKTRINLARLILVDTEILLLDEPFSALDSYLKWNLELELSELLADFGGPILWVSHDLGECCRNCRRVCVMEQGRSGEMTDMAALVRRPTTLGTAKLAGCRNFFPVRAVEGGVLVEDWGLTLPLTAAQKRATLAIPDGAIKIGTGDLACTVRRIIPDLGCSTVLLQPDGAAADSPPLLTALPEGLKLREGERTTCALQPEQLLLF